jgi:hypothetical protein
MERITAVSLCGHVVVVWLLLHRTRESLSRFKIAAGRQHVKLDTRWLKAEAESFFYLVAVTITAPRSTNDTSRIRATDQRLLESWSLCFFLPIAAARQVQRRFFGV